MRHQRLCALDLETTGLNPQRDQILQIGAVVFEPETGKNWSFERLVKHERYEGEPYALAMNARILRELAAGRGVPLSRAVSDLAEFVFMHVPGGGVHAVGFNVQSFDVAFINAARGGTPLFHHRGIELGTLLMGVMGSPTPVKSSEAISLLGEDREVTHDALQDASDAAGIYMKWYSNVYAVTSAHPNR